MWTRPGLNTMFDPRVGVTPDSAARLNHPLVSLFLRMGERNAARRPLLLLRSILVLYALWALAASASGAPTRFVQQVLMAPSFCDQGCAVADLDGDGRPDLAVAKAEGWGPSGFRYRIDLDLTSRAGPRSFSVFAQRGGLRIIPRDVNGDWELDLIITSAWTFTPIGVWINDGHGGFVRSDSVLDLRRAWYEGSRILHDFTNEALQAPVPESSRDWPDYSRGLCLHEQILTKRLTPQLCDVRLPNCCSRSSQTRGPPLWSQQPGSSADAPSA